MQFLKDFVNETVGMTLPFKFNVIYIECFHFFFLYFREQFTYKTRMHSRKFALIYASIPCSLYLHGYNFRILRVRRHCNSCKLAVRERIAGKTDIK